MSGRQWSAIHREANVEAQCMTWLFAHFHVSWVVHGAPRSQVPCSGRDAIEVRRGQGNMQAFLNQTVSQDGIARADGRADEAGICRTVRSIGDLGNPSGLDLGSTIGRYTVARTPLEYLPRTPLERSCVCYRMRPPRR